MPLGICNQCQCRIGERTANGHYRPYSTSRQVIMEYGYPGRAATTQVHVAVCAVCADNPNGELLETNMKQDRTYNDWKETAPEATLSRVIEEVVNG